MSPEYAAIAAGSAVLGAALRPVFDDLYQYSKQSVQRYQEQHTRQHIVWKIPIYGRWKHRQQEQEIEQLVEATYTELGDESGK